MTISMSTPLLTRGPFTVSELVDLAHRADPNVTSEIVAPALERSTLPETEEYLAYGLAADAQEKMHSELAAAAASLRERAN